MFKHCIFAGIETEAMMTTRINKRYKNWLLAAGILLLAAGAVVWYIYTEKFEDTKLVKAAYTVNAMDLILEFRQDNKQANAKYSEKIIVVNGTVSTVEAADTTTNIRMIDSLTGAYLIFAFQKEHHAEAKAMKAGDRVSIKGSCSSGVHSEILDTDYITFKRCALNK